MLRSERPWREQIQLVVCPEYLTSCTWLMSLFCSSPALTFTEAKLLCRQQLQRLLPLSLPNPFSRHAVHALLWVLLRGLWVQLLQRGSISAEVWTFCASNNGCPQQKPTVHQLPACDTALCSYGGKLFCWTDWDVVCHQQSNVPDGQGETELAICCM